MQSFVLKIMSLLVGGVVVIISWCSLVFTSWMRSVGSWGLEVKEKTARPHRGWP